MNFTHATFESKPKHCIFFKNERATTITEGTVANNVGFALQRVSFIIPRVGRLKRSKEYICKSELEKETFIVSLKERFEYFIPLQFRIYILQPPSASSTTLPRSLPPLTASPRIPASRERWQVTSGAADWSGECMRAFNSIFNLIHMNS